MNCRVCGVELQSRTIVVLGAKFERVSPCPCEGEQVSDAQRSSLEALSASVITHSSVPDRFFDARFDDQTPANVRRLLEIAVAGIPDLRPRWHEPNLREGLGRIAIHGRGIGLYGGNGIGKSHAMGAFLRAARERLIPGVMVAATELQLELSRGQRFDSDAAVADIVVKYARVPLLVIDDFDKLDASTSAISAPLYELLDSRSRHGRPLFLTTNCSPDELAFAVFGRNVRHAAAADDRWVDMLDWLEFAGTQSRRGSAVTL